MTNLGDFLSGSTVICRFNTHTSSGSPITLAGSPAIAVYKNSTTQSTAGITLTTDYDGLTGLHHLTIDTSADSVFYAAGNDFTAVITAGTVAGTSVVGTAIGCFSILNRSTVALETAGDGAIEVNHDYGGADELAYKTSGGSGIDNASVRAYLTSDYAAGNTAHSYIVATVTTDVDGRWTKSMMLDAGDYTLVFYKQGSYGPDTVEVTVA